MDRRDLFKIVAVTAGDAALAQHHGKAEAFDARAQKPRFHTAEEYALLDELCETIIPADAGSGGARDAGVRYYIDTHLLYAPKPAQEMWRSGLALVSEACRQAYQRSFPDLAAQERAAVLTRMLAHESSPQNDLERFGVRLKAITIEGYAISEVGMRHFRHEGNHGRLDFPGCAHPPDHPPVAGK